MKQLITRNSSQQSD